MIRHVLNTSNIKKNEIVAKKRRKKFEFDVRRHNIKIKIAKMKITRLNLCKIIMRLLLVNALNIKNVRRIKLNLNNILLFNYLEYVEN